MLWQMMSCLVSLPVSQRSRLRHGPLRDDQVPGTEHVAGAQGQCQGGGSCLWPPQHHRQHGPVPHRILWLRLDLPAHIQTPSGKTQTNGPIRSLCTFERNFPESVTKSDLSFFRGRCRTYQWGSSISTSPEKNPIPSIQWENTALVRIVFFSFFTINWLLEGQRSCMICDVSRLTSTFCSDGDRPSAPRRGEVQHLHGDERWRAAHARLGSLLQLRYTWTQATNGAISLQKLQHLLTPWVGCFCSYSQVLLLKEDSWTCSPWLNTSTTQETARLTTSQPPFIHNSRYSLKRICRCRIL